MLNAAALLIPERLRSRFAPLSPRRRVGVAVSGGADSLGLMLLAAAWRDLVESGPELIVYTVDHGLRPESPFEAEMVVRAAESVGLTARPLAWVGDKPATGIQEAAREARYRLIGAAMGEDGATALLTAHHLNDQAETVLMRLAHGSGLRGLAGMAEEAEVEGITVIRPLLDVDPADLRELVEKAGLVPAEDKSNSDTAYERVRWREAASVLDGLGLSAQRVALFAGRAARAARAIEAMAEREIEDGVEADLLGVFRFDRPWLASLPEAVGIEALRLVLERAGGGRRPRALGIVERLHAGLVGDTMMPPATALGCAIAVAGGAVVITRETGRQPPEPIVVGPLASADWDRRFHYENTSEDAEFRISDAGGLNRADAEAFVGHELRVPMAALRSAPLARTPEGRIVALGAHSADDRLIVSRIAG